MTYLRDEGFATTVISIGLGFVASVASAGHYYEAVTEIRAPGQKRAQPTSVRAWVDGEKARVEFASGEKKGFFADGNYLVTADGGANVYLVDPRNETFARFDLDDMMANLGRAMNMMEEMGGMVKMEVTDTSGEMVSEQPGESILGYPTTRYRYETGYTMSLSMMGIEQRSRNDSVIEIWSTDELKAPGFGVWLEPGRQIRTGNDALDEMVGQQLGRVQGFPLKMVTETTLTGKKGRTQKATATMEVTDLREETVADDRFAWPDHYTETEVLPELEQGIQDQVRDVKKQKKEADARKAEEDEKEKKKGKKGLLRGVFDRLP